MVVGGWGLSVRACVRLGFPDAITVPASSRADACSSGGLRGAHAGAAALEPCAPRAPGTVTTWSLAHTCAASHEAVEVLLGILSGPA